MTNFLFVNGQIRAMESRLLTPARLDRMVGAGSPEDAFRVLTELQYAEYFDDTVTAQDFSRVILQGLLETKNMVLKGTDNHKGFELLWRRYDLNNLKRALKEKLLKSNTELGEFTEENGYSLLGNIPKADLADLIFEGKTSERIPFQYSEAVAQAQKVFAEKESFLDVEYVLDRAHFQYLKGIADAGSAFLKRWFVFTVDSVNIRSIARAVLLREEPLPQSAFLPCGTFEWERISGIENAEDFVRFLRSTRFADAVSSDERTSEEQLLALEKGIDALYNEFLRSAQEGEIDSIQVPVAYFERRLQNARMLKFIMFAKFHGLSSEEIYKTLKQF